MSYNQLYLFNSGISRREREREDIEKIGEKRENREREKYREKEREKERERKQERK